MKVLLPIVVLALLLPLPVLAQGEDDCTPEAVGEWMIQWQVGHNRIQPYREGEAAAPLETLLLLQEVRRNLEDLPRPACADALFMLTTYFYNGLIDGLTFMMADDVDSAYEVEYRRMDAYENAVTELYEELREIAGIDPILEAASIPIVPTPTPDYPLAEEIALSGEHGGVLLAPVIVPPGDYRMRFEAFGGRGVTAQSEALSGDCFGFYTFVTSEVRVIEELFRSGGCELAISISMSDMGWTLTFTPIE